MRPDYDTMAETAKQYWEYRNECERLRSRIAKLIQHHDQKIKAMAEALAMKDELIEVLRAANESMRRVIDVYNRIEGKTNE